MGHGHKAAELSMHLVWTGDPEAVVLAGVTDQGRKERRERIESNDQID
jgi:hypothetical protein